MNDFTEVAARRGVLYELLINSITVKCEQAGRTGCTEQGVEGRRGE